MANYTMPYGPYWPLGQITVATPGTPVPMTQNLNAKGLSYTQTGGSEYAAAFNQIWVQAGTANTNNIYIVVQGGNKNDTNSIVFALAPGQYIFIGTSAQDRNTFGLGDFLIDADTANNFAQVTGIVG